MVLERLDRPNGSDRMFRGDDISIPLATPAHRGSTPLMGGAFEGQIRHFKKGVTVIAEFVNFSDEFAGRCPILASLIVWRREWDSNPR